MGAIVSAMSRFSFESTTIADVVLITPRRYEDARGHLIETYEREAFFSAGIRAAFIQDNRSLSSRRGTVRGLHYQADPAAQAKLVSVPSGAVFDVAVDLRRGSPSYGRWFGTELSVDNGRLLFVPRGCAHGFCTLADDTVVSYKLDAAYSPAHEYGIAWNDPEIGIDWPIDAQGAILSDRDRALPGFSEAVKG